MYMVRVMVFNATFNNISVILWWSVFFWCYITPEYPEKIKTFSKSLTNIII